MTGLALWPPALGIYSSSLAVNTALLVCVFILFVIVLFCKYRRKQTNKTHISLEIATANSCIQIPIMNLKACPKHYSVHTNNWINDIYLDSMCIWNRLQVNLRDLQVINRNNEQIMRPQGNIKLSILQSIKLRRMLRQPYSAYLEIKKSGRVSVYSQTKSWRQRRSHPTQLTWRSHSDISARGW